MVGGEVGREAKLIRGGYRRRLLDHLADGPATVSEAANAVGLRLPHASAELKRLRQEGFVASDSEVGQRGAKQHLTARGLQRINSDELARLKALGIDSIPRGVGVCLLARDGPQLLLAYAKQPVSPLIPVPQRSLD
jgi:DNA-binding transcriptional ArsR family regulator